MLNFWSIFLRSTTFCINQFSIHHFTVESQSQVRESIQEDEDENKHSDEELKEGKIPTRRGTAVSYVSKGDYPDEKKSAKSQSRDQMNDKK